MAACTFHLYISNELTCLSALYCCVGFCFSYRQANQQGMNSKFITMEQA